jgi:biotin operon repressor
MIARNRPVNQSEIDLFKREETAEEFLSRLPPDARPIVLPDGSVVIQEGNRTYNVPNSINNEVRKAVSNVTPLAQTQYRTTGSSGSLTQTVSDDAGTVTSAIDSGSDFLTNVGGKDATTFDYDLSEADLLEAIELRKSAYGVDTIETSSTVDASGNEQRSFIERVGDRLYEVFVSGPSQTITDVSPVSGKTIATKVPAVGGVLDAATLFSPVPGLGSLAGKMGEKFVERQQIDAQRAAVGQPLYGAVQVQEKSTGRIIDLTTSPVSQSALGKALGLSQAGVGTFAEADVTGPVIFNGVEYPNIQAVIREVSQRGLVDPFVMAQNIPAGEDFDPRRVVASGEERMGILDDDSGEVNLGFGRTGAVTGVALDSQGNLTYKTGTGGFITGMGEMVTTGTGIGFTGGRADIVQAQSLSSSQAQSLLSRINAGEITSTPNTTEFLTQLGNPASNIYGDDFDPNAIVPDPIFGTRPIADVSIEDLPTYYDQAIVDADDDQTYGTVNFGDTNLNQMQKTFEDMREEAEEEKGAGPETPTVVETPTYAPDPFYNQSDSSDDSYDTGGGYSVSSEDFEGFAEGGTTGKQEGGTTVKPVSQIVQGAGFIAPQGNATDQQTIADDIPMEAEEGDFIINAPAAEFAGRQDIVDMILEAINSLKEKGVDIQYGNPKIPVKNSVQLAVSRNEVYIPKVIAEEIGYDKLEKINNRGKREVERRQQESQKQANRGGFVRKAEGDVVDKSNIMGADEGNFLQDLGRFVVDELGDKIKGFLSPQEKTKKDFPPTPIKKPENLIAKEQEKIESKGVEKRPADVKKYDNFRNLINDRKVNLELTKDRSEAYDLLNLLEVSPKIDPRKGNVPTNTSGFTVGIGFDIGKHNEQDLRNFNFSDALFNKLLPFSGKIGKQVELDPNFMLTDDELDEVNKIVLNTKYNQFEKKFPNYKKVNPLDKAVLYSAYHLGALTREKNPYTTFMSIYDKTNNITNALKRGIIGRINNPKNYEQERAEKALKWLGSKQTPPKLRPKSIQEKPDTKSFLSPQISV